MAADSVRIDVEGRGIGHVPSCVIRDNSDVIPYFLVLRISSLRIERIARRNVSRPRNTPIGTIGVEQLHICVIRSVP